MRSIKSLEEMNIPPQYRNFISAYLQNISGISYISSVILFGSCAKEAVKENSDIDIFVTVDRDISLDEEFLISYYLLPEHADDQISTDIIVQPESTFRQYMNTTCTLQKQVNHFGVDLSGLISKCPRD